MVVVTSLGHWCSNQVFLAFAAGLQPSKVGKMAKISLGLASFGTRVKLVSFSLLQGDIKHIGRWIFARPGRKMKTVMIAAT